MTPRVTRAAPLAALAVALALPLVVPNEYYVQILTQGYVFAISACGLNVILGFAGQLSLAHAGFFGIGAYTVALLATKVGIAFWAGLPAGIALSAVFGFAIGSICLRSKGHYFAIFTLAVGLIIHLVIQKWESLTHGHIGVIGIPGPGAIGPLTFDSGIARSYLALAALVLTLVATSRLLRSPVGRTLMAVRESEPLAAAVGLDVMAAKRMAFTVSAALAGLAGGLYAGFIGFLGPEASNVEVTFNTLLYVMVGGIGSLSGPVAGTFIVYGLSQVLQVLQEYQMVIFGLALVLLILFMPSGLAGAFRRSSPQALKPSSPGRGK
ncbi:MAG: ABC transporter permease [Acidobacteria bacterium RIFCSPLOWO2_12_FULL_67_14b]|nr:MAG: ABC transporter permease [Acidobacteria bacterium RIFCSPLOWO2_12_FULL_67_14b]